MSKTDGVSVVMRQIRLIFTYKGVNKLWILLVNVYKHEQFVTNSFNSVSPIRIIRKNIFLYTNIGK